MASTYFRWINGKVTEIEPDIAENVTAYVHDDTMAPLRHMVTSEIYESKSQYLKKTRELGCQIVGNDLLSKVGNKKPQTVSEKVILDTIEKAESIQSDRSRLNSFINERAARIERQKELVNGSRR